MHEPSSAHAVSSSSVIDARIIQGLRDLGGEDEPGLLVELIDIFLEDAPQRMRDITEGFAAGDLGRVERGAHTLKSSSANIGALGLSELCRQIVESSRSGRAEHLPRLCEASARSLGEAAVALRAMKT